MHLIETVTETMEVQAKSKPPFGPGFAAVPEEAVKMEVWGSSLKDPGPEYCEFRLLDKDGNVLDKKRVAGY